MSSVSPSDLLKFIIFDFFLLLFYFTFSKYKPTQIPKQTKTDRLRCVPEKTINSSKHALHRTPQDRAPKAGVDESLQIWVQFSPRKVFQEGFPDTQKRIF